MKDEVFFSSAPEAPKSPFPTLNCAVSILVFDKIHISQWGSKMINSVKPKAPLVGLIFGAIVFTALLLRLAIAIANPNILWSDEIFPSEQAHRLVYGYGIVPWEFREGTQSRVFPGILAGVMRLTDWMGSGSSG